MPQIQHEGYAEALQRIAQAVECKAETLWLGGLDLTEIPTEIAQLAPFLKELSFSGHFYNKEEEEYDRGIYEDNGLENIEVLACFEVIEDLNLGYSSIFLSITPLLAIKTLKKLSISNHEIQNIDDLALLTNLRYLSLIKAL